MRCRRKHLFTFLVFLLGVFLICLVRLISIATARRTYAFDFQFMSPPSFLLNISLFEIRRDATSIFIEKGKTTTSHKRIEKLYELKHENKKSNAKMDIPKSNLSRFRRTNDSANLTSKLAKDSIKVNKMNSSKVISKHPFQEFSYIPNCVKRKTGIEDILCMQPPDFLPEYKNPCWYKEKNHRKTLRCLPYFHIIGVCKTGTTDLFRRIAAHPQVIPNRLGKETWYWTWRRYGHGPFHVKRAQLLRLSQFIGIFNANAIKERPNKDVNQTQHFPIVTGHGDPMDFWDHANWPFIPQNDPHAAEPTITTPSLIKHINPNVKLILLLREPVERIFSNYLHAPFGNTSEGFHKDVIQSLNLLNTCRRKHTLRSCLYTENILKKFKAPISGSFYSVHLKEWLRIFPRNQIHISRTEDYANNVQKHLTDIFKFLRLDSLPAKQLQKITAMPHYYRTAQRKRVGNMLPKTRAILKETFEPFNKELAKLLNHNKYLWK